MRALTTLCGGFLLCVLWFDLMFDVQALGRPADPLPEEILASIAGYYRRVTTTAAPMGNLVGLLMLTGIVSCAVQLRCERGPRLLSWVSLGLLVTPVMLAMLRVLPNAMRLGERVDPPQVQSALARSIAYEHLFCLGAILAFCVIQLALARREAHGAGTPAD